MSARRLMSFRDFDWALLGVVLLLCGVSVVEIYSATLHTKFSGFDTRQMLWIGGGLVAMFILSRIDYHRLLDWVPWAYGVFLVAVAAVLIPGIGHKALGGRRWIKLGPMLFQPSEWMKLILILMVARYFANLGGRRLTWPDIFKAFAMVGVPMLLVLKEPDLGTALTYSPVLIAGLFLGGINLRQGLILGIAGLVLIGGAWSSGKLLKPYQKARLTSFINPENDPKGSGYQVLQSKIAVGSGGIWGKGTAKGTQTQGYFLPIPYTDFIFAAFSEEHGFVERGFCPAAILFYIDAFDSKRSNSRGPVRLPDYYGGGGCVDISDCGQRGHGHRVYARHRNPLTTDELRWIVGVVYLPCAGRCDERTHAPVCKLTHPRESSGGELISSPPAPGPF